MKDDILLIYETRVACLPFLSPNYLYILFLEVVNYNSQSAEIR